MAEIRPFKAVRFNKEISRDISKAICPVYDIIDENKYSNYINNSPYNIIRLEKPRGYDRYNSAKKILKKWLDNKILIPDSKDSIYIYEQEFLFNGEIKKINGIICLVKVEDFNKNIILEHENTLSAPKDDRLHLLKSTKSNFSPIFSLYDDQERITEHRLLQIINRNPETEFTYENNITHRLWIIDDSEIITRICNDFKDRQLYIADGHHRYQTAQKFKSISGNEYTMMFLTEMHCNNLIILPTHRLIKTDVDFDYTVFFKDCIKYFNMQQVRNPLELEYSLKQVYMRNQHGFGIYLNDQYFILTLKDNLTSKKIYSKCDVSILNELIIKELLGKDTLDPSVQKDILFKRNINECIDLVNIKKYNIAFFLNPATLTQIINAATKNKKMPQKSTYFFTKVIAGLTIYKMD